MQAWWQIASSSSVVTPGRDGGGRLGQHLGGGPAGHAHPLDHVGRSAPATPGRRTGLPGLGVGRPGDLGGHRAHRAEPTGADAVGGGLVAALELLAAPAPARVVGLEHPVGAGRDGHGRQATGEAGRVPRMAAMTCRSSPLPPGARGGGRARHRAPAAGHAAALGGRRPHASATVLLVHVLAGEAEGWAECAAEPAPTYSPGVRRRRRASCCSDHLLPRAWAGPDRRCRWPWARTSTRCGATRWPAPPSSWPSSTPSSAPPTARWRRGSGATATAVPAGAALGLHDRRSTTCWPRPTRRWPPGAARLRVKVAPGPRPRPRSAPCEPTSAPTCCCRPTPTARSARRPDPPGRAASGSTRSGWPASSSRCAPDDLVGHARLAVRLDTPICLDEPITSLGGARGGGRPRRLRDRVPQAGPGRWLDRRPRHPRPLRRARPPGVGGRDARDGRRAGRQPGRRRACPAWRCRPTSTRAAGSTPTWPTRGCPALTGSSACPPARAPAPSPIPAPLAGAHVVRSWAP